MSTVGGGPSKRLTLCAHGWFAASPCRACADACPVGAIRFAPSPLVDGACVGCGGCVGACPTGAFDGAPASDYAIAHALSGAPAVLACARVEDAPAGGFPLTCLGRVTAELLLDVIRRGARRIELHAGDCEGCDLRKAVAPLAAALGVARAVADATGERAADVALVRGKPSKGAALAPGWAGVLEAASVGLEPPRRARLLLTIADLGAIDRWLPLPEGAAFGAVEIGEGCSGCGICGDVCPTGALRVTRASDRFLVAVEDGRCVACGSCREACPDRAIELAAADRLWAGERLLVDVDGAPCPRCGRFTPAGASCRGCRTPAGDEKPDAPPDPVAA